MKSMWWLAIGAMMLAGPVTAAPPKKPAGKVANLSALPPGAVVLRRVAIMDPGVIAPGKALNALVPVGWTTRGGVIARQGACVEAYGVDWVAASSDGRSSVAIFPNDAWAYSNTGTRSDCMNARFANARDYLAAKVQHTFPGARLIDYRPRPDFAKLAQQQAQATQDMAASMGLSMRAWADGGEMLFGFTANGVEMRGVMSATALFYGSELPNPMGGAPLTSLNGGTLGTFLATSPDGQLDFHRVEAVRRSVTPDANWLRHLFALQDRLNGIAAQGTRERAAMIVAGGAAATKSNIASFQMATSRGGSHPANDSGTSDRIQRESIEAIRGVETYHDPVGETNVQLDATYDHAWRVNNQDAYILTNDPNFNPGQYDIQATQLKALQ